MREGRTDGWRWRKDGQKDCVGKTGDRNRMSS